MMRTVTLTLLSLLLWVGSASAQITVPNTFVASTRIVSADVNQNFSTLGTNALNRTGGTMTGTLTTLGIVPTTNNASDIGASGTRYANVYSVQGNFSGALTAGSTLAVTGNATVGGTLGVTGATTLSGVATIAAANSRGLVITRPSADAGLTVTSTGGSGLAYALTSTSAGELRLQHDADADPRLALFGSSGSAELVGTGEFTFNSFASGVANTTYYQSADAQPGFFAYNSTSPAGVSSTTAIVLNAEVYDTGADFDTATGTFTAPVTGVYLLCGGMAWNASGSADQGFYISVAGTAYVTFYEEVASSTVMHSVSGCAPVYMTASQTAKMHFYSASAETGDITGSGFLKNTFFAGRLQP